MDKVASVVICNSFSPDRFEKLASPLGSFLSKGIKSIVNNFKAAPEKFSKGYKGLRATINQLPGFMEPAVESGSFLENILSGMKATLNPYNIVDAIKYGPSEFLKEINTTTLNPEAWKNNPLTTGLTTLGNTVAPVMSILPFMMPVTTADGEEAGIMEKSTRRIMDVADLADLSDRVISRKAPGFGGLIGRLAARIVAPSVAGKVDELIGTSPSKQKEKQRMEMMKKMIADTRLMMNRDPYLSSSQAFNLATRNNMKF